MELDELEIGDARTCVIRQGNAVTRCHDRVRCLAEGLTGAARREQGRPGAHLDALAA